jgi:hypothetical protein
MAVALYGNNGYKKNVNITIEASQILKPVRAIEGRNQLYDYSITGGTTGGASVDLTSSQILQAAIDPMGLQLGSTGGAYNLTAGGGPSATNALAYALQQLLGIDAAIGHGKFLRFFWLNTPTADITLQATSTPVAINTLGTAGVVLCDFTALAGGVTYNSAEIYVQTTAIGATTATVLVTITKQGGAAVA